MTTPNQDRPRPETPGVMATRIAAQFKDYKRRRKLDDVIRGTLQVSASVIPTCEAVNEAIARKRQRGLT